MAEGWDAQCLSMILKALQQNIARDHVAVLEHTSGVTGHHQTENHLLDYGQECFGMQLTGHVEHFLAAVFHRDALALLPLIVDEYAGQMVIIQNKFPNVGQLDDPFVVTTPLSRRPREFDMI